jgi:hypothetical protein
LTVWYFVCDTLKVMTALILACFGLTGTDTSVVWLPYIFFCLQFVEI